MNRKLLFSIVRIVFTLVVLVLLFKVIDFNLLLGHLRNLDIGFYLLGFAAYFGFIVLWTVRWRYLVQATGEKVSLLFLLKSTLIGEFFGLFLPEAVGSDLARAYNLSRDTGKNTTAISTVLIDRAIALISLALMAGIAVLVSNHVAGVADVSGLVFFVIIGLIGGWFLFFNKSFMRRFQWIFKIPYIDRFESGIRGLYHSLHKLHEEPRLFVVTLLMSVISQMVNVVAVILISRAVGTQVDPIHYFVFMPIIWIVTTIPISISGLGVREGAFAFFFTQVGMASSAAIAVSFLHYACRIITGLIGGLLFLQMAVIHPRKPADVALQGEGASR